MLPVPLSPTSTPKEVVSKVCLGGSKTGSMRVFVLFTSIIGCLVDPPGQNLRSRVLRTQDGLDDQCREHSDRGIWRLSVDVDPKSVGICLSSYDESCPWVSLLDWWIEVLTRHYVYGVPSTRPISETPSRPLSTPVLLKYFPLLNWIRGSSSILILVRTLHPSSVSLSNKVIRSFLPRFSE